MTWFLDGLKLDLEVLSRSLEKRRQRVASATAASRRNGALMISPLERARLLDAEMQLQRAWLELNLREISSAARKSPWAKLNALKLGVMGVSIPQTPVAVGRGGEPADEPLPRRAHKEKA